MTCDLCGETFSGPPCGPRRGCWCAPCWLTHGDPAPAIRRLTPLHAEASERASELRRRIYALEDAEDDAREIGAEWDEEGARRRRDALEREEDLVLERRDALAERLDRLWALRHRAEATLAGKAGPCP